MASVSTQLAAWKELSEKAIQQAAARSINRTGTSARVEASKLVREEVNLKATDAKEVIDVTRVSSNTPLSRMVAYLKIAGKPIPLYKYGALPKRIMTQAGLRIGVTVKVKKERKLVRGAFIATMPNGKTGIFWRGSKTSYDPKGPRHPIKHRLSTSVLDVFKGEDFLKRLQTFISDTFKKNFERELKYQLDKQRGNI